MMTGSSDGTISLNKDNTSSTGSCSTIESDIAFTLQHIRSKIPDKCETANTLDLKNFNLSELTATLFSTHDSEVDPDDITLFEPDRTFKVVGRSSFDDIFQSDGTIEDLRKTVAVDRSYTADSLDQEDLDFIDDLDNFLEAATSEVDYPALQIPSTLSLSLTGFTSDNSTISTISTPTNTSSRDNIISGTIPTVDSLSVLSFHVTSRDELMTSREELVTSPYDMSMTTSATVKKKKRVDTPMVTPNVSLNRVDTPWMVTPNVSLNRADTPWMVTPNVSLKRVDTPWMGTPNVSLKMVDTPMVTPNGSMKSITYVSPFSLNTLERHEEELTLLGANIKSESPATYEDSSLKIITSPVYGCDEGDGTSSPPRNYSTLYGDSSSLPQEEMDPIAIKRSSSCGACFTARQSFHENPGFRLGLDDPLYEVIADDEDDVTPVDDVTESGNDGDDVTASGNHGDDVIGGHVNVTEEEEEGAFTDSGFDSLESRKRSPAKPPRGQKTGYPKERTFTRVPSVQSNRSTMSSTGGTQCSGNSLEDVSCPSSPLLSDSSEQSSLNRISSSTPDTGPVPAVRSRSAASDTSDHVLTTLDRPRTQSFAGTPIRQAWLQVCCYERETQTGNFLIDKHKVQVDGKFLHPELNNDPELYRISLTGLLHEDRAPKTEKMLREIGDGVILSRDRGSGDVTLTKLCRRDVWMMNENFLALKDGEKCKGAHHKLEQNTTYTIFNKHQFVADVRNGAIDLNKVHTIGQVAISFIKINNGNNVKSLPIWVKIQCLEAMNLLKNLLAGSTPQQREWLRRQPNEECAQSPPRPGPLSPLSPPRRSSGGRLSFGKSPSKTSLKDPNTPIPRSKSKSQIFRHKKKGVVSPEPRSNRSSGASQHLEPFLLNYGCILDEPREAAPDLIRAKRVSSPPVNLTSADVSLPLRRDSAGGLPAS